MSSARNQWNVLPACQWESGRFPWTSLGRSRSPRPLIQGMKGRRQHRAYESCPGNCPPPARTTRVLSAIAFLSASPSAFGGRVPLLRLSLGVSCASFGTLTPLLLSACFSRLECRGKAGEQRLCHHRHRRRVVSFRFPPNGCTHRSVAQKGTASNVRKAAAAAQTCPGGP